MEGIIARNSVSLMIICPCHCIHMSFVNGHLQLMWLFQCIFKLHTGVHEHSPTVQCCFRWLYTMHFSVTTERLCVKLYLPNFFPLSLSSYIVTTCPYPSPPNPSPPQSQRVQALYDFEPQEEGELRMRKGDIVTVLEKVDQNWWKGTCGSQSGLFPAPYVKEVES